MYYYNEHCIFLLKKWINPAVIWIEKDVENNFDVDEKSQLKREISQLNSANLSLLS